MPDFVVGLSEPGAQGAWGLLLQGHCRAAREAGDAGPQPGDAHQHRTEGCERASAPPTVPAPLMLCCRKLIPPGLRSNSTVSARTAFVHTFLCSILSLHLPAARRASFEALHGLPSDERPYTASLRC